MSQPTPPELSRQKRLEGHKKSLYLRQARASLKRLIAHVDNPGKLVCLVMDCPHGYPEGQGMKVYDLLLALPYIGPKKADALLLAAGIVGGAKGHEYPDRRKTVRACGPKQRERLFKALAKR